MRTKPTEIWKSILGYEDIYAVSNFGNVKSIDRIVMRGKRIYPTKERILKQSVDKNTGYSYVNLYKNKKLKRCTVHRLVAQAFIPNPNNLPQVNHKDENRLNNCVDNLEWITNYDNLKYSDAWHKIARNRRDYHGSNNPFYGKTHSDKIKKKISEICKGKIYITDEIITKRVTKEDFENIYKQLGWRRGMRKRK